MLNNVSKFGIISEFYKAFAAPLFSQKDRNRPNGCPASRRRFKEKATVHTSADIRKPSHDSGPPSSFVENTRIPKTGRPTAELGSCFWQEKFILCELVVLWEPIVGLSSIWTAR
ncbi:MAG TPA: hypothetical protein H9929_01305 [Candidatus Alistipes excrementavium]|nr:hypothetical protein [Candidatus Alistipes excrementavium]